MIIELDNNGENEKINQLQIELKTKQMQLTKINSEYNSKESNIKIENKKYKNIQKNIDENKSIIEAKKSQLNEMKTTVELTQTELGQAEINLKKSLQEYEALCCGFVLDDESDQLQTIQDQLLKIKNKISDHQTIIKKANIK